jgi:TRAP-type mannitol/chloroaromatic compound transport system permease large subunit
MPLDLLMFAGLIIFILMGYPVAFTIAGIASAFALFGWWLDAFPINLMGALGQRFFGIMTNPVLTAIPLFVLMGVVLEKSRIAEELLETMGRLFGQIRGGLGVSVMVVGALLAASTGIVGATVVAMGLIALPAMLRNGYDPRLAAGAVCTAGTLGQIIPPSTLLIILAEVMSSAFQQAQYSQGRFSIETISVGQTFAAALVPGLMLVAIYIGYILARALLRPQDAPAMRERVEEVSTAQILGAILPPVILIVAVLGAILGGIASPNEAASVGAVGCDPSGRLQARRAAMAHPVGRARTRGAGGRGRHRAGQAPAQRCRRAAVHARRHLRRARPLGHDRGALRPCGPVAAEDDRACARPDLSVTAMIFATILMASYFSLVFVGLGGEHRVMSIIEALPGGATGALIFAMVFIFLMGFFLDFVEISVILLPLLIPPLILMGHDPIWLAVLIAVNLQTSFLTPALRLLALLPARGGAQERDDGHDLSRAWCPSSCCRPSPS